MINRAPIYKIFYTDNPGVQTEVEGLESLRNQINRWAINVRKLLAIINETYPDYTYEELRKLLNY